MFLDHTKKITIFILAGYLASCSIPKTDLVPDQKTLLTINEGVIIGTNNGKTHQWLGIQYGSIPDSSFRWRKASEPETWEESMRHSNLETHVFREDHSSIPPKGEIGVMSLDLKIAYI